MSGVTAIETSVADVTVSLAEPETFPDVAVMIVLPAATDATIPLEPAALLIVATDVARELHVTDPVRSCVELSVNVPIAVNCSAVPGAMLGDVDVTAIDTSAAAVTVRLVDPEILPKVAIMVVLPAATGVTNPFEPAVLLIVATDGADELQVTYDVISRLLLSEKTPVAVNCSVVPRAIPGLGDTTAIKARVTTFTVVEPDMLPEEAVIVVLPAETGAANPFEPAILLIVATVMADELQVTDDVISCVLPSENVPVAVNC